MTPEELSKHIAVRLMGWRYSMEGFSADEEPITRWYSSTDPDHPELGETVYEEDPDFAERADSALLVINRMLFRYRVVPRIEMSDDTLRWRATFFPREVRNRGWQSENKETAAEAICAAALKTADRLEAKPRGLR